MKLTEEELIEAIRAARTPSPDLGGAFLRRDVERALQCCAGTAWRVIDQWVTAGKAEVVRVTIMRKDGIPLGTTAYRFKDAPKVTRRNGKP